jgi:acyl-coenzyme A thioesterase PaaI-like protein
MKIQKLFEAAYQSDWGRKKLNAALKFGIPFNIPHKFKIEHIQPGHAKVSIPYIRKNLNHLKGIHACCLATCAEFTTGLVMMSSLPVDDYRIIMESIEVKYHFQAKMACAGEFQVTKEQAKTEITDKLKTADRVSYTCEVPIHDTDGNLVCTGFIKWQIKAWSAVRTAV